MTLLVGELSCNFLMQRYAFLLYYEYFNISFMKTMTCNQLGGACDLEFHAETFKAMAEISKKHGMEMFQKGDEAHMKAMSAMKELMQKPGAMQEWFANKKREFEAL